MIDLRYRELEEDLRGTVRKALAGQSPPERVLARCEAGDPYDPALWRTLAAEIGLAGLAVPERYGGGGAGARESAVVLEELGRAVAPVPYLGSAVVATAVLRELDDQALLTGLAAGATIAALAVPFASPPAPPTGPAVRAAAGGLTGTVPGVVDALPAEVLLVPATDGLYAVPADADGVSRHPLVSLDLTRPLCDLTLAGAPGRRLADRPSADRAVTAGLTAGAGLLASEQLGVAQWCLETTVEYLRTRYQFGRPIGSFQALRHRLADLWVELAQARAVARYAAGCLALGDPDTPVATALAQAFCGPAAVHAAEVCVQLHGGIGFTWEHPAHLYLKRAKSAAIGFGTADWHRATLATLIDLPL
jgi:alkylation response protein AidB-like acyl-CoA dehydrogenase